MADVWLPGAYIDRGRNAGYNSGRSQMRRAVAHYTVGADSRNVGRDGYFHFLVHKDASRENGCTQYAEVDAVTWHAAAAGNPYGPGIEWERNVTGGMNDEGLSNAEPLTENQIEWGGRLVDFLAEWGIPAVLYDGARYGADGWDGWVNHQAIDSQRSDGLLRAEWDTITSGGTEPEPPPAKRKGLPMFVAWLLDNDWVDVWYATAQIATFHNDGPHNVFGVGPRLQGYLDNGAVLQTYGGPGGPSVEEYTRETPIPGIRAQLSPDLRLPAGGARE